MFLCSSAFRRSANPESKLPPPESTMFPRSTWRRSVSHAESEAEMSVGIVFGRFAFEACKDVQTGTKMIIYRQGDSPQAAANA